MTHEEFAGRIVAMQGTLYRVSCSMLPQLCDREDAVQSCIEIAWRKQSALRDDARLEAWVLRILVNECHAIIRKRKREIPRRLSTRQPSFFRLTLRCRRGTIATLTKYDEDTV